MLTKTRKKIMNTHADKMQAYKRPSVADGLAKMRGSGTSLGQVMNDRPAAGMQGRLQEMADNSRLSIQLAALQDKADNSPSAKDSIQLQARADHNSAPRHRLHVPRNDTGLPDDLKAGMEHLSGISLDDVKVHFNSGKPAQLQAHAYAQGRDIHIGPGQEEHLPHEAWHVVQQKQGRVRPTLRLNGEVPVNDDAGLEKESDAMGKMALQMQASPGISASRHEVLSTSPGGIVQRELAVQVIKKSDLDELVDDVSIQGRPEGVLAGEEGSHTTAWVVSTEGVRNAVVGKSFQSAAKGIGNLIDEARAMPGYARVANQTFVKEARFYEHERKLNASLKAAESNPGLLTLQELIEAYLTFRNALPLSAVKLGATADGKGEPKWIKVLYDWENQDQSTLQEALLSLIDYGAIDGFGNATSVYKDSTFVEDKSDSEMDLGEESGSTTYKMIERIVLLDAPGATPKDKTSSKVKKDIVTQHLMSVKTSFPEAYEKSGLGALDWKKIYKEIGSYDELHKRQKEEKINVKYPVTKKAPSKPKTAVQIDMGPDFDFLTEFDTRTIKAMKIAGRPRGVFGSQEKSHTTAWSVIEQGPKTACIGKTLPVALGAMKDLSRQAFSLPQTEMENALPPKQQGEFQAAWKALATDVKLSNHTVHGLQQIVVDYLNFKNLMPYSAVDLGKKADSHGEPEKLDKLRNHGLYAKKTLQEAIWGLLDREAMVAIGIGATTQPVLVKTKEQVYEELFQKANEEFEKSGKRRSRSSVEFKNLPRYEDVEAEYANVFEIPPATHRRLPGVPHPSEYAEGEDIRDKARRVGMVIGNHLKNIKTSFPIAYEKAQITEEDVKNYVAFIANEDKDDYSSIAIEFASVAKHFI